MKRIFVKSLAVWVLFSFHYLGVANAEANPLKVLSLNPSPNYGLCQGPESMAHLVDGKTVADPIWTRGGCLGWTNNGPVRIMIDVGDSSQQSLCGTLMIHTAKGTKAGAEPPARIDVYNRGSDGNYYYAAGVQVNAASFRDNQSFWIPLHVDNMSPHLLLILRPNGNYLFTDEIDYKAQASSGATVSYQKVGEVSACVADSEQRLRQAMISAIKPPANFVESWTSMYPGAEEEIWVVDRPFGALPQYPPAQTITTNSRHIDLTGFKGWAQSACVCVLNLSTAARTCTLKLGGGAAAVSSLHLMQAQKILAAEGTIVFDPLVRLAGGALTVPPGEAAYLWVQCNMGDLSPGQYPSLLTLTDTASNHSVRIPIDISVANALRESRKPTAVNWAYPGDKPIWNCDNNVVISDLVGHGINVFVVPSWDIPAPQASGVWDANAAKRLASDLTLYKGNRLILLFLNIYGRKLANYESASFQQQSLRPWLSQLQAFMLSQGLSNSQWALYPEDEPSGDGLKTLAGLLAFIKKQAPNIQIFEDPTTSYTSPTKIDDLQAIAPYVDIWQPNANCAYGAGISFFQKLSNHWSTYSNPPSPAKSASPEVYMADSWFAWAYGATGTGFWSYSDTDGTSAWNDLDGKRPDWAVVYENAAGPLTSRRWEAFREGLQDFQLLQSISTGDVSSGLSAQSIAQQVQPLFNQTPVQYDKIWVLHQRLLVNSKSANFVRPVEKVTVR